VSGLSHTAGAGEAVNTGGIENEVKLRVHDIAEARSRLEKSGFRVVQPRVFEENNIYDTPAGELRSRGELLRLRMAGDRTVLTHKGPPIGGPHKSRPETEVGVSDFKRCHSILGSVGFQLAFRYEKYRTEFAEPGIHGTVTLDETPIGTFLELEGEPEWVDATASRLGFRSSDYITDSYARLYLDYCEHLQVPPQHMIFTAETTPLS
jgi:adenylate cyclase class 2